MGRAKDSRPKLIWSRYPRTLCVRACTFLQCFLLLAGVIILRCSRRTGSLSGVVRSVPDSTQATTHQHPHLHPGPHCADGSLSQSTACTLTSPTNWSLRSKCKMCLVLSVACVCEWDGERCGHSSALSGPAVFCTCSARLGKKNLFPHFGPAACAGRDCAGSGQLVALEPDGGPISRSGDHAGCELVLDQDIFFMAE